MVSSVVLGLVLGLAESDRLYGWGPYNESVPRPESVLGYELGDRHSFLMDQERVVAAIGAASDREKVFYFGKSWEGRPLRAVALSSPKNIARLDAIQAQMAEVAKGNKSALTSDLPTVVWVNECIHGDETASFESAMALIYNLSASNHPDILRALEESVVMVNPCYNPDGHERYIAAYNSIPTGNGKGGSYDRAVPSAFMGRTNHYRFDMNRDRIAMSQAETRAEVNFLMQWNPQVYMDQHGQVHNYFMPPVQQSINANVDRKRYEYWSDVFGRATANAFDAKGWSYFIRDSFDFYAPCYLDTFTAFTGAIGMTHETNGGRVVRSEESDGYEVTLREGLEKHVISAMAVLMSAVENRSKLLESYADFKAKAASGEFAGKFKRVVLQGEAEDLRRMQEHLERSGIRSTMADGLKQSKAHDYWSDWSGEKTFEGLSLVVDMAQPMGPLAKSLLEPGSNFEPDFIARQKALAKAISEGKEFEEISGFEFYDLTGWSLPYGYGLQAWWCEDTPNLPASMLLGGFNGLPEKTRKPVGYALKINERSDLIELHHVLNAGARLYQMTKAMNVGGDSWPKGTILLMSARNGDLDLESLLGVEAMRRGSWVPLYTSYPDTGRYGPGSDSYRVLRAPKIAAVHGEAGSLTGGAFWYLMEQEFRLPYRTVTARAAGSILDEVNVLVVPEGATLTMTDDLKAWVESGGSLVLLGGGGWAMGESGFFSVERKRIPFEIPGSLFEGLIKSDDLIGLGYRADDSGLKRIGVPVSGTQFVKADENTVVSIPAGKLLTGWSWDDTKEQLTGISFCQSVQVGSGRVTWFAEDPCDRAQWPGLWKMLLTAMVLGGER